MCAFHTIAGIRRTVQITTVIIRDEQPEDAAPISALVREAFESAEHSSGTEGKIVDALREAKALSVSLVAVERGDVVGYVAISPVSMSGAQGWHGLGPVAVSPDQQRKGIGSALIWEALARLRAIGAAGCVVLGEPAFYGKFGFSSDPRISCAGLPPPYFQALHFRAQRSEGSVTYHPAFDVSP
jgi:predicted N-acetyltransferase YhbS